MKKKYLAIIPSRKGSKRVKNKNLQKINGQSLIDRTVKEALKCKSISSICISTDIKKATNFSKKKLLIIQRPKKLCNDVSKTEEAILHCIKFYKNIINKEFENIILLQTTSPFRTSIDINNAIKNYERNRADSLFSGVKTKQFIWKKNKYFYSSNFNYKKRQRTQNMSHDYIENGAIFIFKTKKFLKYKNRLFGKISFSEMNLINSFEIDDMNDLKLGKEIAKTIL